VIGRSAGWSRDKLRALHGLNRRLNGLAMMTYDQLLIQGERIIELVAEPPARTAETGPSNNLRRGHDDDDLPF
jgi:hypothetical protein